MYLSSREKMIIEQLLKETEEITMNKLAEQLAVSARTIHRDLKGMEQLLQTHGLTLTRKTGVGIQITGSVENKELFKRKLMTSTLQDFIAEERQTLLLGMLYEAAGPVKLFTLAEALHVTAATISNDLEKLDEQLAHFHLSIIRKRGYGIELSGSEEAKRRAISYNISKSLDEDEFLSLIKRNREKTTKRPQNTISERLLHLVDRENVLAIEETIRTFHPTFLHSITESAYVGLIVHLTLAIDRIQRGEKIEMAHAFLAQLKEAEEYETAKQMIDQLSLRFLIEIPEAEIGYITMHLQGAKLREHDVHAFEADHLKTVVQAKQLIQAVETLTSFPLMNNGPLLEGLVTHLKPALYRIEQEMGIRNPLLANIRKDYEDLFQLVKEATSQVFSNRTIPDEEIGFLVLHFGAAIIGLEQIGRLTAYVVCSSGIGTSKMLATQLRREVPEIEEVRNVSAFELTQVPIHERDLVISTIQLRDVPFEYIVVSPFLTEDELKQVKMFAKRASLIQNKEQALQGDSARVQEDAMDDIQTMHRYSDTMMTLLNGFQFHERKHRESLNELIRDACEKLADDEVIQHANRVVKALFEREKIGSLGIPGTAIALFHTRHVDVLKPSFTIYRMREPVGMKAMDGTTIDVMTIVLLLAPTSYCAAGMEVVSFMSSMMIESDRSIEVFQSTDGTMIQSYISTQFKQFLQEKIK